MVLQGRKGRNLYTNSLVALDVSGKKPKMRWYYQLMQNDTHDADPAMIPVLFEGAVRGKTRRLVAIGDKAGNFVILDRQTGEVVHPCHEQAERSRHAADHEGRRSLPAPPQYIPGQPYEGGALPRRQNATGVLSAVDVDTGKLRWRNALPYPAEGGVLVTSTGLAFSSDVGGNLYAFDAAGHQYWKDETGSSIVAPISAYSVNGTEYLVVVPWQ